MSQPWSAVIFMVTDWKFNEVLTDVTFSWQKIRFYTKRKDCGDCVRESKNKTVQETDWIPCQTSAWLWAIPCRVPFPCFAHDWRQGPSRSRQCSLPEIASHARADSAPAKRGLWETIETIEKGGKKGKAFQEKGETQTSLLSAACPKSCHLWILRAVNGGHLAS